MGEKAQERYYYFQKGADDWKFLSVIYLGAH